MSESNQEITGSCLCGDVTFLISGNMRHIVACHCSQCQRSHGHFAAYSRCARGDLTFTEERGLKWFKSSDTAERGFCQNCGSSLFWLPSGGDYISVAAGSIDDPKGLKLVGHIFCDDKPAYYSLDDNLPKYPGSSQGAFD